jgi:uncharacterized protein (DUF2141 family)
MKIQYFILLVQLVVFNWAGKPLPEKKGIIIIEVEGSRNDKGYLLVSLFKEANGFPTDGKKAFRKTRVNVNKGITLVEWNDIPEGAYAAALLHDENNDQKMNLSMFGLPKEGYAFSNNAMGLAGPPSFQKASFFHQGERTVHRIKLRY